MKKIVLLFLLIAAGESFAQTTIHNYKYVMVPSRFSFLNEQEEYRISSLMKALFEKYGFQAYIDTEVLPEELVNVNCNKLFADIDSKGNFIKTKLIVTLKDCRNNIVFSTAGGESREKEWTKAYNEALREAFKSFDAVHYKYKPSATETAANVPAITATPVQPTQTAATETSAPITGKLYPQAITNGYQFVDTTPKVVMKVYKTSNKDTYTAVKGNIQGVLVTKDKQWFFEYYQNDVLISEKIDVQF